MQTEITLESVAAELQELGKKARYLLKETFLDKTRSRSFRDEENYETELIQVAASAIAALTDKRMQYHEGSQSDVESEIFAEIMVERDRQDTKFGRSLPVPFDPLIWIAVLVEETAEVAAEIEDAELEPAPVEKKSLLAWELFQRGSRMSAEIEEGVRSLMVELADLGECSGTFAEAVSALEHLENITRILDDAATNLKPQPSMTEVAESWQKLLKPFRTE